MTFKSDIEAAGLNLPIHCQVDKPADPQAAFVFAHGAGAGMEHAFMQALTEGLVAREVAVVRYQFPYMQRLAEGKRWGRPDPPRVLQATVARAVAMAIEHFPGLPLFAGGKSLGGRMTSTWATREEARELLSGLVFLGFPLHPASKPGIERSAHLGGVEQPMLFLQGDRDALADLSLLRSVVEGLGPRATLHVARGADHSFQVLKRSGRTEAEVLSEITTAAADWMLG